MNKQKYEDLSKEAVARWITLLSGIDTLDKFCLENNKNFDDIEIKIPAIKHYMEDSLESIKQMQKEDEQINANKSLQNIRAKITRNFLDNIVAIPTVRKRKGILTHNI